MKRGGRDLCEAYVREKNLSVGEREREREIEEK